MSRAPRTTKCQKELIIHFLEENPILLGGKINPLELPRINGLWEKMTTDLNRIAPPKSVKTWKDTISEMKTKVRKRARELKYGYQGTGGGAAVKPLTPLEERLLALLSLLTIEGVGLAEAGGEITLIATGGDTHLAGTENADSIPVLPKEEHLPSISSASTRTNVILVEAIDIEDPGLLEAKSVASCKVLKKSQETPSTMTTPFGKERKPKKFMNRARVGGRVTSAIETHDKHLANLSNSNYAIARALNNLARAISAKQI